MKILNVIQEFKNSFGIEVGVYLVDFKGSELLLVRNGLNVKILSHYVEESKLDLATDKIADLLFELI